MPGGGDRDRDGAPGSSEPSPSEERTRLIEAITRTAAERGYANTTVDQVASYAGLPEEAFYRHFRTPINAWSQPMTILRTSDGSRRGRRGTIAIPGRFRSRPRLGRPSASSPRSPAPAGSSRSKRCAQAPPPSSAALPPSSALQSCCTVGVSTTRRQPRFPPQPNRPWWRVSPWSSRATSLPKKAPSCLRRSRRWRSWS